MENFGSSHFISPWHLLRFSARHWWRILIGVVGAVGAALLFTALEPQTYESSSLVLVKLGREYLYRSEVGQGNTITPGDRSRQAFVDTEMQILRSQNLIRKVVSAVGVNKLYPALSSEAPPSDPGGLTAAVAAFSADLSAVRMLESDVIRITFRHSDPELTARALNLLGEHFKEQHLQAFSDPQAAAFLQEKVNTYRQALAASEEKLKSFQLGSRSFSVDDQRVALFQQRRDIEAGLTDARNQMAGLREKLRYLKSEQEKLSADGSRGGSEQNKAIADARLKLLELQLQEQKLLASFSESSRSVQSLRKQIALVTDFADKQKAAIGQGEFAQELDRQSVNATAELRYQEARGASLLAQLAQVEEQLGRQTATDAQYRELLRDRESNEKNYQTYLQKLEEARISDAMDREKIASISVIQDATVPLSPIWPSKALNTLVGVIIGLAIGYGWAFASERLGGEQLWPHIPAPVRGT
jgi:uncharacterized protein involved in exopolysaccharide biosynthesis